VHLREAKRACHVRIREQHSPVKRPPSDEVAEKLAPLLRPQVSGSSGLIKAVSGINAGVRQVSVSQHWSPVSILLL
jgi:hypothetical protein